MCLPVILTYYISSIYNYALMTSRIGTTFDFIRIIVKNIKYVILDKKRFNTANKLTFRKFVSKFKKKKERIFI